MKDESKTERLLELANAHIENQLDEQQRTELEDLLRTDAEARRIFSDFLHDHASLYWSHVGQGEAEIVDFPIDPETPDTGGRWRALAAVAAAAAIVAVLWQRPAPGPATFATMEQTRAARWESGALPTAAGARLSAGRLRLAEGLATIRFDSGAEVVLEAPAEIELVDRMNCVLRRGTAVAEVPESAVGFQITTPSARVVDYGTRFAVNVDGGTGATKTHVFEGEVEVAHPGSGRVVRLRTGQRNYVAGGQVSGAIRGPEEDEWAGNRPGLNRGPDWRMIPAARDRYIYSQLIEEHMSDVLLLLKNARGPEGPNRKSYLGFDLSELDRGRIVEAELILSFEPTGWGLASGVPDSRFSVYGLLPSELDGWSEDQLSWTNAPANLEATGDGLEADKVRKLGSFVLKQGVQRGQFGIHGERLTEFLRRDPDGFVTLIVVRDTVEERKGSLVHGFASRRHPVLPAPTLALRMRR